MNKYCICRTLDYYEYASDINYYNISYIHGYHYYELKKCLPSFNSLEDIIEIVNNNSLLWTVQLRGIIYSKIFNYYYYLYSFIL